MNQQDFRALALLLLEREKILMLLERSLFAEDVEAAMTEVRVFNFCGKLPKILQELLDLHHLMDDEDHKRMIPGATDLLARISQIS